MMLASASANGWHDRSAGRERQEAAQAIVEDEHHVLALHLSAAAKPTGDTGQAGCTGGRSSSTNPRCFMPRRSVSRDLSRSDAPAKSEAMRHHVSGV